METTELTEKSRAILEAIAKGHTYEQILVQDLAWTYHDIFQAAAEALDVAKAERGGKSYDQRMDEIRQDHPALMKSGALRKMIGCVNSFGQEFR